MSVQLARLTSVLAVLAICQPAKAHFAWLTMDGDGHAVFFFGESIADQTYHLPETLAETPVKRWANGSSHDVPMTAVDSDSLAGKKSSQAINGASALTGQKTYGIYKEMKLSYHAQHVPGSPNQWSQKQIVGLELQSILTPGVDGGVIVQVLHNGKPLAGAKVQLFCDDGHEEGVATTNAEGQVEFNGKQVEQGLNGLLVGHEDKDSSGEFDGTEYSGEANYLTVTFHRE